jgi:type VI protein secretion system component VasK
MKSEEEMRKLVEAVRKVKPLEPSRKPPPLFIVWVVVTILVLIYVLWKSGGGAKPNSDFDIKRAVREQQQEDARKNLEDAQEAYRRSLQPIATPRR